MLRDSIKSAQVAAMKAGDKSRLAAVRLILAKRAFLGLLAVAFVPFIVRVIQIYIVTRFPEAGRILPIDGRLFGDFLNQQIGFTILLSIFGASGLIANDLRTGAILVYLSRPLTQRDYITGKLLVPLLLLRLRLRERRRLHLHHRSHRRGCRLVEAKRGDRIHGNRRGGLGG